MKLAATTSVALLPVALRDTARTVVALRSAHPPPLEVLRGACDAQLAALQDELKRHGQPQDVIDDALYAQCALLDETALKGLHGEARSAWEREPLQVRIFRRNDAGEELLRRIGQRLREAKPVLPLLSVFAAVLKLGFRGRLPQDTSGDDAHAKLVSEIDERLTRASGDTSSPRASGPIVINPSRWRRRRVSPLVWVSIACIAAALVWFAIDRWLLSVIAGMAH